VAESSGIDPSIPCFLRNRRHAPFSAKQADDEIIKLHKTVVDGYRSLMDDRSLTADDRAKLEAATSLVDADGRIDDHAVVAMSDSDSLFVQKVIDRCGRDNTGEVDMSWDGPRVFMLYS
jgi:Ca2+-binding EF-hand superfamily protein